MKKTIALIVMLLSAIFSIQAAMAAEGKPLAGEKLVITVKTGEVMEAGMGLSLAHSAVKKGAQVTVVLGANAALYPAKKGGQEIFAAKGKTPREMIQAILKDGGTVYLCSLCADFQKFEEKDLIEGVKIVKSIKIWEKLFEDGAKSMSF